MVVHSIAFRSVVAAVLFGSCVGLGTAPAAFAAASACFVAPAKLSDDKVAAFMASPSAILTTYAAGGLPMANEVRALAGSSADTLDALIALVSQASSPQKAAIGAGLARAAKACAGVSPDYAALIQEKIAGVNSPELVTAFLSASNDVQTAALGGGATGGAAGGAGGGAGGLGGSAGAGGSFGNGSSGDSSTANTAGSYSSGGGSSVSLSVSPSQ